MSLVSAAEGKQTDKLSAHSYLPIYERLFASLRDRSEGVLEIGAWYGGSLLLWAEYFSRATIFGCDVNSVPLAVDTDPRIRIVGVDAYSPYAMTFFPSLGPFVVIIDDGPHTLESQKTFCANFPGLLATGGIAIVEDVQLVEHFPILIEHVPKGFHTAIVDLRHIKDRSDDMLLLIWK
jgi:cephalosporin hydroxylase